MSAWSARRPRQRRAAGRRRRSAAGRARRPGAAARRPAAARAPSPGVSRPTKRNPSPAVGGGAGVRDAVRLDRDPVGRDAVVAQVRGDRVGERDEPVHRSARCRGARPAWSPSPRSAPSSRGSRRAGSPAARTPCRGSRGRCAPSRKYSPVDADLPVVVHGLHHRHAVRVRGPHHPGRQQRVRVVQVQHVRPLRASSPRRSRWAAAPQIGDSGSSAFGAAGAACAISSELRRNGSTVDPGRGQLRDLGVDDDVLAGRLRRRRSGCARRRPS